MRLLELELDKLQAEADSYTNAPPNIVRTVWDRFVEFRKRRTELEREVSDSNRFISIRTYIKLGIKTTKKGQRSYEIL